MNWFIRILLFILCISSWKVYGLTCPSGMYGVQKYYRQAHYRNGKLVKGSEISAHCRYYRSDGPLKSVFESKMPKGWPQKKEKFKKCSQDSQKKINKSLSILPKILTDIGSLKLHCANKSIFLDNPASSAPSAKIIVLYDSAFNGDLSRYLAHELAHVLYDRLSDEEKKSLHKISLWTKTKNGEFSTERKKFSEIDGRDDPDEDFSNNVEHYLFEKKSFKKNYPKIFNWLDTFWRGKR